MDEILVAIDLGPSSQPVLDAAASLARRLGARLHVLHVAPPDPDFVGYDAGPPSVRSGVAEELREEHARLEELVTGLRNHGIDARARLARGATVDTIVAEAERAHAELIVVGRHARGALLEAIVGSTARALLHESGHPVLVVTHDGT